MKNEMKILNTYINNVCKGIRDRKVKNELKDELLSHLLEIYERNIALGLSDEDAQKDAVAHMGDSEAVAETFKKIYPVSSEKFFKDVGGNFAWCIVFCVLWSHWGFNAIFITSCYLMFTLSNIKNINKALHNAYNISKINFILHLLIYFAYNNIIIHVYIMIVSAICLNIMTILTYIFTIVGLVKVRKDLGENKTYKGLAFASIFAIIICFIMVCIQLFVKQNIVVTFSALAISLLPAGFIYTVISEDIDRLGTGVPQEKKNNFNKHKIIIVLLLVITVPLLFTSEIFTYYQPVEYVIDDTQTNINETKDNLIELGLPDNVANELPESEILKYKGATELHIDSFSDDTYSYSDSYYTSYNFTLCKNDNAFVVRTLMVVENFEDFKEKHYTELFIDCYKYDSSDIFCKFLCDYNSETKEISPIKCKPIEDESFKDLHYVFPNTKDAKNHRAYISMTVTLTPMTDDENYFYKHKYAQTRLVDINNPYSKYWTRDDDWFSCSIANPYYIETEDNNNIGFGALFEILENLPEDESIDLSELESTMEDALGQDVDSKLLENMFNQITDEVSTP
ncbi:MAG: hypothetical protein IJA43_07055 [Clostridia bacterium]|nr:hypothetical protein [Clostridia bacterium]